jgi:hypothetical protein
MDGSLTPLNLVARGARKYSEWKFFIIIIEVSWSFEGSLRFHFFTSPFTIN